MLGPVFIDLDEIITMKVKLKSLLVPAVALLVSACSSHTPEQVHVMENLDVIRCAEDAERGLLTQEHPKATSALCVDELKARRSNGKITDEQYEMYQLHLEALRASYRAQYLAGSKLSTSGL